MNRYTYGLNNPTSLVDPSGLFSLPTGCGPDNSGCDEGPSNPPDCVAWGTEGCIPYPSGDPGSGGSNGGSSGSSGSAPVNPNNPFTFKVNVLATRFRDVAMQAAILESVPLLWFDGIGSGFGAPSTGCPPNCGFTLQVNVSTSLTSPSGQDDKQSSVWNRWPFNGGMFPITPQPQDGVCTTGPLSGPMNSNPAVLSCCRAHDACYAAHGCNATSWIPFPINPNPIGGACSVCNARAAACITKSRF